MVRAELVTRLERSRGGLKIVGLRFSDDPGIAIGATLQATGRMLSVTINPYTGEVLGSLAGSNTWLPKVRQFHANLLLGASGKLITGAAAVVLLVLSVTGLVLWWPRKIWKLGGRNSGKKVNFDLHNALGFWSSISMLMFGFTGAVIHWDNEVIQLVNRLTGTPPRVLIPAMSPVNPDARAVSAGVVYEAAIKAVPGAAVNSIQGLNSTKAPVRVTMRFPEDRTPAGRTNVYIHPATGEVMAQDSRSAPPGYRWVKLWNRQFHTGDELGMTSRILTCLASLSLPLLAITGPLIWWGNRRRRRGAG